MGEEDQPKPNNYQQPQNVNVPHDPERWWNARRGHAKWAAINIVITMAMFSGLALYISEGKLNALSYFFITNLIIQTIIIVTYVVSATYMDKVIKPFSNIVSSGMPMATMNRSSGYQSSYHPSSSQQPTYETQQQPTYTRAP